MPLESSTSFRAARCEVTEVAQTRMLQVYREAGRDNSLCNFLRQLAFGCTANDAPSEPKSWRCKVMHLYENH